jgi:hypothetical protein
VREALSRYIRSLTEQEQDQHGPEHRQDLGTFVDWLLERMGFAIYQHPFRYNGAVREKNSGNIQYGIDILAGKPDEDGQFRIYRFVLKTGKIGISEWASGPERGSIVHDIRLAAGKQKFQDIWRTLSDVVVQRFTVVAVHNGDLDRERLDGHVAQLRENLLASEGVDLQWWDAGRLVELALTPRPDQEVTDLQAASDTSLFPPGGRPFARAVLDSLRRSEGYGFDLDAVDRLLEELLPLDRVEAGRGPGSRLSDGRALEPRFLHRRLAELALFARMVQVDASRFAGGSTLPVLDAVERILCRAMEQLRRIPLSSFGDHRAPIGRLLRALLDQYVAQAEALLCRLEPFRAGPYGLAIVSQSEPLDYPIRALRFGGYLATAGFVLLADEEEPGRERARKIAEVLHDLWQNNEGGFANPVCDDQIIELSLIWELWSKVGMEDEVAHAANVLLNRLVYRKALGLPLPALYQSARLPMRDDQLQTLVETYLRSRSTPPAFEDRGSTIAPLAEYLVFKAGHVNDERLQQLAEPRTQRQAESDQSVSRSVYLQSWMPPDDAATEWYARGIERRGEVHVFDVSRGVAGLVEDFEAFNRPLPKSPAEEWGLPVIDRMAWKLWRTPPPMALFIRPPR